MTRPTYAIIDTDAFVANYRAAKAMAPGRKALAVVKANAYGHGAVQLARILAPEADAFAVACSEEAMELRDSGIRNRILLLEGVFEPDELGLAAEQRLDIVVHNDQQVAWLDAAKLPRPLNAWLKVDTGMHRLGFAPEEAAARYQALSANPNVGEIVVMTHFARADEPEQSMTREQLERFRLALEGIDAPLCLANSATAMAWPSVRGDWIRPGIMLYGASPIDDPGLQARLRPVMTFEAGLISIRDLTPGESIGYGARFVCERPTRVGVVAAGYADGYPRHAPDGTPVAIGDRVTRIIGRVSMDMLTVDLNKIPDAQYGDLVRLWGTNPLAQEVAAACGTIAYELFTRVTSRVKVVHTTGAG
jgi:alanine racemase